MFTICVKDNKEISYICPSCREEIKRKSLPNYSSLYICPWCRCLLPNLEELTAEIKDNSKEVLVKQRKILIEYHKEKYEDYYCG